MSDTLWNEHYIYSVSTKEDLKITPELLSVVKGADHIGFFTDRFDIDLDEYILVCYDHEQLKALLVQVCHCLQNLHKLNYVHNYLDP